MSDKKCSRKEEIEKRNLCGKIFINSEQIIVLSLNVFMAFNCASKYP